MTMNKPLVQLDNIGISFGERSILHGINLEIEQGKIIAITGKSGTGKSTLLGIISGLLKPDDGTVHFQGQNIFRWGDMKRSRFRNRKMGFVFQFFSLFPELTAYENILYPAILNPFTSKNISGEIGELVDFLKIGNIVNQYPASLSGGERQRVAIARAIINNPLLILADEPTGNLDEETTHDIIELFIRLKEERGITTILATHETHLVRNSDIAYRIEDGAVERLGAIKSSIKKKSVSKTRASKTVKKTSKKKPQKKK
jgi:lipoprotein-releasing system ATP-binding protein